MPDVTNQTLKDIKLENILLTFANRVLDTANGKGNPTLGELIDTPTDQILAHFQSVVKEAIGEDKNTHWSACNNHGVGRPNYKCVCPVEPQNQLRAEIRQAILSKLGEK